MLKQTMTAALIAALATPALAGGPVVIEDTAEVEVERPAVLWPLLLLAAVAVVVVASGDDNECSNPSTC